MTTRREAVLRDVAARIAPGMRIGVDGVSAAGKTTFADELAQFVQAPVVRASFDDFHRPAGERYARGEGADSYYEDAFDAVRFRRELLEPFRRGAPIRTAILDHARDRPVDAEPAGPPPGSVLLVDGIWLHKPELRDAFELTIWLAVDREVALARAIARDAAWLDDPAGRYATRYVPGESRYLREVDPERLAGLVVENTDPAHPRLLVDSNP